MNLAAIPHLPCHSDISVYMTEVLHCCLLNPIQDRPIALSRKTSTGSNSKISLQPYTRTSLSVVSSRPLQSADRLDLLVPQAMTVVAQHHVFCHHLPFYVETTICDKILVRVSSSLLHCMKSFLLLRDCNTE